MSLETIRFAGGCFWGVEKLFRAHFKQCFIQAGYAGGHVSNPTYEQVCTGRTGYAEVINIRFDPDNLKLDDLIRFFFRIHDPTEIDRQGPDIGSQYRSAIFTTTDDQRKIAQNIKEEIQKHFKKQIQTQIVDKNHNYFTAEEYHQKYLDKHPHGYECPTHFLRSFD